MVEIYSINNWSVLNHLISFSTVEVKVNGKCSKTEKRQLIDSVMNLLLSFNKMNINKDVHTLAK